MEQMIISLLPVFIIILVGMIIRKLNLVSECVVSGLKTIIIKVALPGVLFMAFAQIKLEFGNLIIFIMVFLFCALLYLIGGLLHIVLPKVFPFEYTNAYFTGFEFGMIGIGLFTAIWGMDKLPIIAVIAFGHEIFIWFVYIPILEARKTGHFSINKILKDFIKMPTIIGILLGIIVNILGLYTVAQTYTIGLGFLNALTMLGNVIAPLILIIIGYAMTFQSIPIKKSLALLISRWVVVVALGFGMMVIIKWLVTSTTEFFEQAFFAFILLPPPFVLPLFIKEEAHNEIHFFSEHTVLSFIGYIILMSIF